MSAFSIECDEEQLLMNRFLLIKFMSGELR